MNHSDFISNSRAASGALITAIDQLRALRKSSDALNLAETLVPDDFAGNTDVDTADVMAVIGTTLDAIETLLAQGHATNLYNLMR